MATPDGTAVGEIQVRGPNLFLGYLDRPDATAGAMTADGWFRTGDMATRAPDGSLHIVGRRDTDLIESGGFRIGAGEIENVLLEHPGVADAAVTGEPDPDLGQRVTGWIVAAPGAPGMSISAWSVRRTGSEAVAGTLRAYPGRVNLYSRLPRPSRSSQCPEFVFSSAPARAPSSCHPMKVAGSGTSPARISRAGRSTT